MKVKLNSPVLALFVAAFGCALVMAQTTSPSANLEGKWKWDFDVQGMTITWNATFSKQDGKLVGSAVDGFDDTKMELKNVKVEDGKVSFTADRTGDFQIHFTYNGKLEGDTIKGTCETKFGDTDPTSLEWNGKRVKDSDATTKPAM